MKKTIGALKWELEGQRKLGNMIGTLSFQGKDSLKEVRDYLKTKDYTEGKLIYREGQYVISIVFDKVDNIGLGMLGLRKFTKEEKEQLKKSKEWFSNLVKDTI